jgi:predicted PurR-regulated permease PerM
MFVLIPAILGKSVDLHPVLLLLSIFLFGSIFGLFGVLMAVPLACIVKILFQGYVLTRLKILSQPPLES